MYYICMRHAVVQLRHCATSRKVAGSIPDGVTEFFFHWHKTSGRTMGLGLTQPPTEMSKMVKQPLLKAYGAQRVLVG